MTSDTHGFSREAVRRELDRILQSRHFVSARVAGRFLSFAVEMTLRGEANSVKEYTIAVEVYGKPESFDPRTDPIVRVEARRLRSKLIKYYECEGRESPIRIGLLVGSYVPVFTGRDTTSAETCAIQQSDNPHARQPNWVAENGRYGDLPQFRSNGCYGSHYLYKWSAEGLEKAIAFFGQVLEEDPSCAAAYSLLADALLLAAQRALPSDKLMPRAKAAALKALALDDSLVGAHTLLAIVKAHYEWNWNEAESEYQCALTLNPRYAGAHQWYSWCLAMSGRPGEAIPEAKQLLEIEPVTPVTNLNVGSLYYLARDFGLARFHYNEAINLDPTFYWPYLWLGRVCAAESDFDEAIAALEKARHLSSDSPVSLGILGYCYGLSGRKEEARRLLNKLQGLSRARWVSSLHFAYIHIGLGDRDSAFERLQKAASERHPYLGTLKTAPLFDSLRSDRRFPVLLKKMNL
jgi:tetratricopeptide (TPR) repeat protein